MSKDIPRTFTFSIQAIAVIAAYIAAQMLADIASLKIGIVFNLAVDMGTFIYPITFTLRDLAHKSLGKRTTRYLIVIAGIINLVMAVYLYITTLVPGDATWGLNEAYKAVMSPVWRIVFASIFAEVISELLDTEVYHLFIKKVGKKYQWLRVLVSNSVSVPLDNFIFAFGAFAFALPLGVVWEIFLFNLAVKYAITLLSMPMIYLVKEKED